MRSKNVYKISSICLAVVFLALTSFAGTKSTDQRNYTSKWTPKRKIASIDIGGLLSLLQVGYNYKYTDEIWGEEFTISDYVDNSEALGFSAGAGFYIIEYLEIAASMNISSKSLSGRYGFSLPNVFLWDDIASDQATANSGFRETVFHFVINFHPITSGNIRPFIGAGVSYISGKMDLPNDIIYEESFFLDWTHEVEITEIEFAEADINKLGFNFTGGMDFYLTHSVAFCASGRYIIAKQEFEHPLTTQWDEGETLELNLGGLSANLGIKLFF
ncbi:MAG TPA: hypothetical protein VFG01_12385 [Acidobacteriota bacterium]|nr:hypothetical protein [Acidobacteriota bacterium]